MEYRQIEIVSPDGSQKSRVATIKDADSLKAVS